MKFQVARMGFLIVAAILQSAMITTKENVMVLLIVQMGKMNIFVVLHIFNFF